MIIIMTESIATTGRKPQTMLHNALVSNTNTCVLRVSYRSVVMLVYLFVANVAYEVLTV